MRRATYVYKNTASAGFFDNPPPSQENIHFEPKRAEIFGGEGFPVVASGNH